MRILLATVILSSSIVSFADSVNVSCNFLGLEESSKTITYSGNSVEEKFGAYDISVGLTNLEGEEFFAVEIKYDGLPHTFAAIKKEELINLRPEQTVFGIQTALVRGSDGIEDLIQYQCIRQ